MSAISELLRRYGSLKSAGGHSYGALYDELFGPIRDAATAVLEVGVYAGASVRAWHDFFQSAHVYGVSVGITSDCALPTDRYTHVVADCRNPGELHDRVRDALSAGWSSQGNFDVCVDDGCHEPLVQVATFAVLSPHLRRGGVYVIEDVGTTGDAALIASTFGGKVVDSSTKTHLSDDRAVVFVKT